MVAIAEDRLVQDRGFVRPMYVDSAELQKRLLELREFQYFARYGDHLKIIPTTLRSCARKRQSERRQTISGN